MARIVSPKKVMAPGSCKIFKKGRKRYAVCKGAIGILTPRQVDIFVSKAHPARKKIKGVKRRWKKFAKIARKCSLRAAKYSRPKKGKVFKQCMSREGKKAGIKF